MLVLRGLGPFANPPPGARVDLLEGKDVIEEPRQVSFKGVELGLKMDPPPCHFSRSWSWTWGPSTRFIANRNDVWIAVPLVRSQGWIC